MGKHMDEQTTMIEPSGRTPRLKVAIIGAFDFDPWKNISFRLLYNTYCHIIILKLCYLVVRIGRFCTATKSGLKTKQRIAGAPLADDKDKQIKSFIIHIVIHKLCYLVVMMREFVHRPRVV